MFRKRDTQESLFGMDYFLPPAKARRLEGSWAEMFRRKALPLIDEEPFAALYSPDAGRPNRPVETVLGVLLLKEMFGLTDMEALEQLEFNLLWHHALALSAEEAHLCQKTLHNFRSGLTEHDLARVAFAETTDRILIALGTKTQRQRLDSTHIISNMAVLTRLGLFCETSRVFLSKLRAEHPRLYGRVPEGLRGRYLKEDGQASGYGDARSSQGRRRLAVCARDTYRLCELFAGTAAERLEEYVLLERLLDEQCEVVDESQPPESDDDDAGEGRVPVVLKAAKQVSSASLQSPHDPDATYSGHKGKGYEVQVAETCDPDNATQIITHVEVTDSCVSDSQATVPTLEALEARDLQPEELVADTTYGSGDNAVEAARRECELISPVGGPAAAAAETADGMLTAADFEIDPRPEEPAICPAGHFSRAQRPWGKGARRLEVTFEPSTCQGCPLLDRCPVKLNRAANGYLLRVDLAATNLERRHRAEASGQFKERYAPRAGIEATNSELKRGHALDDVRVRGRPRVEVAVYLKALACNVKRMVRTFMSEAGEATPAMA